MFAGLRERHPEVAPAVLTKRAVLGLTHALEDEFCARAASGFVLGSFQRERFYRQAQRRWAELARTAELVVAVADFPHLAATAGAPIEVPVNDTEAMAREWTLVHRFPRWRGLPGRLGARRPDRAARHARRVRGAVVV